VLHEDSLCMAFRDVAPAGPFHALVVPKKRVPRLCAATPEVGAPILPVLTRTRTHTHTHTHIYIYIHIHVHA
jgi:diadenosine tetraphosphate (Ap4A) HIT family hydrolase